MMQDVTAAPSLRWIGSNPGARLRRPLVGLLALALAAAVTPQQAEARGLGFGGIAAGLALGALLGATMSRGAHARHYAPRRHAAAPRRHHVAPATASRTHKGKTRTKEIEPENPKTAGATVDPGKMTPKSGPAENTLVNRENLVSPPPAPSNAGAPPAGVVATPVKMSPEPAAGAAPPPPANAPAGPTPGAGDLH